MLSSWASVSSQKWSIVLGYDGCVSPERTQTIGAILRRSEAIFAASSGLRADGAMA